jgi:3-hydroxyacyl-CoA dehydrogenase/enoyl-CoA hydratase/3-hydroxybutyryl-CoA epimerase
MRTETAKKAPAAYYPAPYALISLWENHGGNPQDMAKAVDRVVRASDGDRHLAQSRARVLPARKLKALADGDWTGQHVHVIGAGAMGGDIAAWCAWHGFTVTLADMKASRSPRRSSARPILYGKIGHKRIAIRDCARPADPDSAGEGVRVADLVIEAVPETLELKRKVYAATEPRMKPGAILATNTSSIPLQELREACSGPIISSACTSSIRCRACSWSRW